MDYLFILFLSIVISILTVIMLNLTVIGNEIVCHMYVFRLLLKKKKKKESGLV